MTDDTEGESIGVSAPNRAVVGATRGEREVEIGPPSDQPDYAEVTVTRGDDGVVLSVDVTAGDLGTGHADVTLSGAEAAALADALSDRSD